MRMNVWTAYRMGMRTKTGGDGSRRAVFKQLVKSVHHPKKFSWTLRPMDFLRYREFDFALKAISKLPVPSRMLDLSSPKLLPLTLAANTRPSEVVSTDILPREVQWTQSKATELGLKNLRCELQDARRLDFGSEQFDLVTSISVFEHIAPEKGGDIPAIREMARVLKPGGHAIITVPFSREYFADYQDGDVYERLAHGREKIFFQRFYTEAMIQQNFVDAGGLKLISSSFIEEQYFSRDPSQRIAHWVNGSSRQTNFFGPMYPLLSHVFLSPPRPLEKCRKPYIACLVLQKPTSASTRLAA